MRFHPKGNISVQLQNLTADRFNKGLGSSSRLFRLLGVGAVAGWIGVIFLFLGTSNPPIPGDQGLIPGGEIPLVLGHLFLFWVLGLLTALGALQGSWTRRLAMPLALGLLTAMAVAVLTEYCQLSVSGRDGNLVDVATNTVGVVGGTCLVYSKFVVRRCLQGSFRDR